MIGNNYALSNLQKANEHPKVFKNTIIETERSDNASINETPAVKLSISPEGSRSYRDSQTLQEECESYESVLARQEKINRLGNKLIPNAPLTYSVKIGNRYKLFSNTYRTTEEKASELLKAYADIYSEIVQGYETGQMESYIYDPESEDGYRKRTLAEEIDVLNTAYKGYVEHIEREAEKAPETAAIYEDIANQLSEDAKLGAGQAEKEFSLRLTALKLKSEVIPENISEKIMAATKAFVRQFTNQRDLDIVSMLENIKIF